MKLGGAGGGYGLIMKHGPGSRVLDSEALRCEQEAYCIALTPGAGHSLQDAVKESAGTDGDWEKRMIPIGTGSDTKEIEEKKKIKYTPFHFQFILDHQSHWIP